MKAQQSAQADLTHLARRIARRVNDLGFTKQGFPMRHTQALEVAATVFGHRNRHSLRAALAKTTESDGPLRPMAPDYNTDYELKQGVTSCWISVGPISVNVRTTDEGVVVNLAARGREHEESIASTYAFNNDALQDYAVMLMIEDDTEPTRFECAAETAEHAVEQALDAYPGSRTISVEVIDDPAPDIEAQREAEADQELTRYSFGDDVIGVGEVASPWDTDGDHLLKRLAIDFTDGRSEHVSFHVVFHPETATVADAYGYLMTNGGEIGRRGVAAPRLDAMHQAMQQLEARWGNQHPHYQRRDWQHEVANGDTKLGYWEYVQHAIEGNGGEEEHCTTCGKPQAEQGDTPLEIREDQRLCEDCIERKDLDPDTLDRVARQNGNPDRNSVFGEVFWDGDVGASLEFIGEGCCGDFDETNPDDEPLLRLDFMQVEDGEYVQTDASGCTQCNSAKATPAQRQRFLEMAVAYAKRHVIGGEHSFKSLVASLTWCDETWDGSLKPFATPEAIPAILARYKDR